MYELKEIFVSIAGEGFNTGRKAVFLRFSGCNLFDPSAGTRESSPCPWCDTDFTGTDGPEGGNYTREDLLQKVEALYPKAPGHRRLAVFTGGEPALQLDEELVDIFRQSGFECAVESNGTLPLPKNLDWITVSPKPGCELVVRAGNELKLCYPVPGLNPEQFEHFDFEHFYLQPVHGVPYSHPGFAMSYCMAHPRWRLGLQTQKILGIP